MRIFRHAYDFKVSRMLHVVAKVLSDGVAVLEIFLFEEAVHHGNIACGWRVLLIRGAPFDDFRADGFEVMRARSHPRGPVIASSRGRGRLARDEDAFTPVVTLHGTVHGEAHLHHPWNRR